MDDDQIAELRPGSIRVTTIDGSEVDPPPLHVEWDLEAAKKDGKKATAAKTLH